MMRLKFLRHGKDKLKTQFNCTEQIMIKSNYQITQIEMLHPKRFQSFLRDMSGQFCNISGQSSLNINSWIKSGFIVSILTCCDLIRCSDKIWKCLWSLSILNTVWSYSTSLIQRPLLVAEVPSSHERMFDGYRLRGPVPSCSCLSCPVQVKLVQTSSHFCMCTL